MLHFRTETRFGLFTVFVKFGIPASKHAEARLYDSSCTEVDEDVFEEVLKQPNLGVFLLRFENSSHGNILFFKHLHEHLTVL